MLRAQPMNQGDAIVRDSATSRARPSALVLEAVPPELQRGSAGVDAVMRKIETVHDAVGLDAVNIPEIREEASKSPKGERRKPFAPRLEPRELAWRVQESFGLPCMVNRVVAHDTAEHQLEWFRESWERYGVRRFVLVGGERSDRSYPGPSVPQAAGLLRERLDAPGLQLGGICIPTRENEADRVLAKTRSGLDFFTTQIVYHGDEFSGVLRDLPSRLDGLAPPQFLLTLCPVRTAANIRFLHWLGVSLSEELEAWLTEDPERVCERSLAQIRATWSEVSEQMAQPQQRCPVGISLAPIGRIPAETTVALAQDLLGTDDRRRPAAAR